LYEDTLSTDTRDTGRYDTGSDSFGDFGSADSFDEPYDFGEAPSPVAETSGSQLRSPAILSGLGRLGGRAFGILSGNNTEGMRSAARGVAETVQGSGFGETASDTFVEVRGHLEAFINGPRTIESVAKLSEGVGTACLEGAGVIKKTKHWGGIAESGYRPSATGITRTVINPFGAARRSLMSGGDQVVRNMMKAKDGLTKEGVRYVQEYAAQQNPFMRLGINLALKRAKKQGWI